MMYFLNGPNAMKGLNLWGMADKISLTVLVFLNSRKSTGKDGSRIREDMRRAKPLFLTGLRPFHNLYNILNRVWHGICLY